MPGYILHLTAAQMFLKNTKTGQSVAKNNKDQNDFLIGNLLPDTTKIKARSHFRDPKYHDHMVEYPETTWFLEKYQGILSNRSVLGYLFHLYIDRRFFKDYMPSIIEFQNKGGQVEVKREDVIYVKIKRSGEKVLKKDFFSEQYYYGDYTKMNTYLVNRYQIPINLDPKIENPGIEEVVYSDVEHVLQELKEYLKIPANAVEDVKVFQVEELLEFLENAVEEFDACCNKKVANITKM